MRIPFATREEIYKLSMDVYNEQHGDIPLYRACLHMAQIAIEVINIETGITAIPQAGSMSWPFTDLKKDDGVSSTHYSFIWTPGTPVYSNGRNLLPEMHVWVAIPHTREIVDLCVGSFRQAVTNLGYKWTAPEPPSYLWTEFNALPEGCLYRAHLDATRLAMHILRTL